MKFIKYFVGVLGCVLSSLGSAGMNVLWEHLDWKVYQNGPVFIATNDSNLRLIVSRDDGCRSGVLEIFSKPSSINGLHPVLIDVRGKSADGKAFFVDTAIGKTATIRLDDADLFVKWVGHSDKLLLQWKNDEEAVATLGFLVVAMDAIDQCQSGN